MDLNDIRSGVTVFSFLMFLGIVAWAWSRKRNEAFEAAAQLPFQEEARPHASTGAQE
jgi:cytochrome c oxidase cbb3-type subunit 4